jgi:beta-glucosidase
MFVLIFRTTYLPVWKKLIDEKAIVGIMSGISAVNGIPSAANKYLLNDVLRNEWNFPGYVISKIVFFLFLFLFFSF